MIALSHLLMGRAMGKHVCGHMWTSKGSDKPAYLLTLSSACASSRSDQSLLYPLTESLDTSECTNEEEMPGRYFAHAQNDLNMCMFRGTFSLDTALSMLPLIF